MRRRIGATGEEVTAIALGAWQLSNDRRPPDEDGIALIRDAVEAGVELIDSADCYAASDEDFGHNESLVRAALDRLGGAGRHVRVATKVGFRRPGGQWVPSGRPEYIVEACEASLRRLRQDAIFLYQLHTVDPDVPLEESVGALAELSAAGKVQHLGLSNVSLEQLRIGQGVARIETVQNKCNAAEQEDVASGLLEHCRSSDITYLPYHPVGSKDGHAALSASPALSRLAGKYGVSPYRLLLAWLLGLGPHVLPIPGTRRLASVLDNLGAAALELEPDDHRAISALAA